MSNDLYIQVASGDSGSRPYNSCNDFWTNQSIWLAGHDAANPTPSQTSTVVGLATDIKVRVRTRGTTNVPFVKVQAWVLNPQVGLASPQQAIDSFESGVQTVAAGSTGTAFTIGPWTPTQAELSATVNGHLCLAANAFTDSNLSDTPDGQRLQPTDSFDMCNNAHQGQRNIVLVSVTQGMRIQPMEFVVNPPKDERVTLAVSMLVRHKVDPAKVDGLNEWWLLKSHPDIGLKQVQGREALFLTLPNGAEQMLRYSQVQPRPIVQLRQFDAAKRLLPGVLQGPTKATLDFGQIYEEPVGTTQAFDMVLRDEKGRPVGSGLRVLTVVVP